MMRRAFSMFSLALLSATPLSCSSTDEPIEAKLCAIDLPTTDWRLTTEGTHFRDAVGRTVLLRGINAGGRSKLAPYMPFDFGENDFDARLASYMDRARAYGFDVLRVPFTWAAVEPAPGTDDLTFLGRYDALVDAAWQRGMRVVVDFHQDIYAEALCGDGFPDWTLDPAPAVAKKDCKDWFLAYFDDPEVRGAFDRLWAAGSPVQAGMADMWTRMATRYKDRPGVVAFEILNEPAPGTMDAIEFESQVLPEFYTRMIAVIRAVAPQALIFIDATGPNGAFVHTKLRRPEGEGVVFAPHFYGIAYRNPARAAEILSPWAEIGASWNVPVFLGEFGYDAAKSGAPELLSGIFDGLDALGFGGTAWEYSVTTTPWNHEHFSIVAGDGTELPTATSVVRPFARAVAGDIEKTGYDTATKTFTLSFTATPSGVTEVSLPERIYPNGYDVELSSGCVDRSHEGELRIRASADGGSTSVRISSR